MSMGRFIAAAGLAAGLGLAPADMRAEEITVVIPNLSAINVFLAQRVFI
ncbi:MAG TPA: hypothetical protein VFZ10_18145 [Geminicoccaceae bacterium]